MTTQDELLKFIEQGQVPPVLLNNVRLAVDMTFSTFYSTELDYLNERNPHDNFDGLVGLLSFVGDLTWSIALGLPRRITSPLSEKFLGFKIDYEESDMGDMVGELVNIIAGDVAARLDAEGIKVELSIPTTARGSEITLLVSERTPTKQMSFKCPDGNFWLEVAIDVPSQFQQKKIYNEHELEDILPLDERNDMEDFDGAQVSLFSAQHIDAIKKSVIKTFGSICGSDIEYLGKEENGSTLDGIVGIVSLIDSDQTWSLMLGFPQRSAVTLGEKFAGFTIEYDSDDMGDVIGELCNVLAGDVATRFDSIGVKAELSIPLTARGKNMNMLIKKQVETLHLDFKSKSGDFWLKLATEKH